MTTRLKSGRGGHRAGSGRPLTDPAARRVTISACVRPDTKDWLSSQKESAGQVIDRLVEKERNGEKT